MTLRCSIYSSFTILALIANHAFAEVKETATIKDATATVTPETLLIFDIDNTIMMPAQMLGGEEWFDYIFEKYRAEAVQQGDSEEVAVNNAVDRGLAEWNAVQLSTKVAPVEDNAPAVIKELQGRGVKTLGLTARPKELIAKTHDQLEGVNEVGIKLGANTVSAETFVLPGANPSTFNKGILFVGAKNNKGLELEKLFKKLNFFPKKIVFVDNKLKHVQNVEKVLKPYGIDYLGCRHAAADAKIAQFNPKVADVQYKYFVELKIILSNSEAEKLVDSE